MAKSKCEKVNLETNEPQRNKTQSSKDRYSSINSFETAMADCHRHFHLRVRSTFTSSVWAFFGIAQFMRKSSFLKLAQFSFFNSRRILEKDFRGKDISIFLSLCLHLSLPLSLFSSPCLHVSLSLFFY